MRKILKLALYDNYWSINNLRFFSIFFWFDQIYQIYSEPWISVLTKIGHKFMSYSLWLKKYTYKLNILVLMCSKVGKEKKILRWPFKMSQCFWLMKPSKNLFLNALCDWKRKWRLVVWQDTQWALSVKNFVSQGNIWSEKNKIQLNLF